MTINNINVEESIAQVNTLIAEEDGLSPALKASLKILLLLVSLLVDRLGVNSKNSSKPPSADPNRKKKSRSNGDKKPGGQKGHNGSMLHPVAEPDHIESITLDRSSLPAGDYRDAGFESRQVIELDIGIVVTEYRAQVLENQQGKRYVAPFPEEVTRPVQYGKGVKAHAVYMSQYQLIPYNRVGDHFDEQMNLPISAGTIFNFNQDAYNRLELFDLWVKRQLIASPLIHADETGININGKLVWLHNASNINYTYFSPHAKRGCEALDDIGILPQYNGILCHDHWKPYYKYGGLHSLCNAHHLRELERAYDHDGQQWAKKMSELLKEINRAVQDAENSLDAVDADLYRQRYRDILEDGDKECPAPDESQRKGKRGRLARSKSRNLLERLRDYETDTLRFMDDNEVPFSNNLAENDIRMTKVHQKISGCFRSWNGARIFCRVRSYLSTCRKQGISASEGLRLLFEGKSPQFMLIN